MRCVNSKTAGLLATEHLAEQAHVPRVILNHKDLERLFSHERGSRGSLTTDSQKVVDALHDFEESIEGHGLGDVTVRMQPITPKDILVQRRGRQDYYRDAFSTGLCLISSRTSRPSFFGRFKSSQDQIRPGTAECFPSRWRKSIASAPSDATCRLTCTLASLNASRVSRTSPGLSSTKRTSTGAASIPSSS